MAKTSGYSRAYRLQRQANGRRPLGGRGVSVSELRVGDVLYTGDPGGGRDGNRITAINRVGNFYTSGGGFLRRDVDGGGFYVRRRNGVIYPIRPTPFDSRR